MQFSLLDFKQNYMWRYELHPPLLIIVATLPWESWNIENAYEHKFSF